MGTPDRPGVGGADTPRSPMTTDPSLRPGASGPVPLEEQHA